MKRLCTTIALMLIAMAATAQDDILRIYAEFRNQAIETYTDFRKECNDTYVEFLKHKWKSYSALKPIESPKEQELPPVVLDDGNKPVIENRKLKIDELVPIPSPGPRPQPVSPIIERPIKPSDEITKTVQSFDFFGTAVSIRARESQKFILNSTDGESVASAWQKLSGEEYDNMLFDCLKARDELKLCDWAYLEMIFAFTDSFLGGGNASTLLAAYLYSQSGYGMRLGASDRDLVFLFNTEYQIYGKLCFVLDDGRYYQYRGSNSELSIVDCPFPQGKPLSLSIHETPAFAFAPTSARKLSCKATIEIDSVGINRNLMDFYSSYPSSQINGNPITRWALYANTPMDPSLKAELHPQLRRAIEGKSDTESVGILLDFVQTAFAYERDDNVWGDDRAFFSEETLFYPYCDCEDRAILFSRLVRDMLGLDVLLVYYPGHLATAVRLGEKIKGDCIATDNGIFLVCDPTYIGAPIGASMPGVDKDKAKAILLN